MLPIQFLLLHIPIRHGKGYFGSETNIVSFRDGRGESKGQLLLPIGHLVLSGEFSGIAGACLQQ